MSKTYSLVACYPTHKIALWIGQSHDQPPGWQLYQTEKHLSKLTAFLKLHEGVELRFVNDDKVSCFDFLTVEGVLEDGEWKFYPWTEEDFAIAKRVGLPYKESLESRYGE
jgi:hypothetical protein